MHDLTDAQQILAYRFAHVALPIYATDCDPWEWFGDAWKRYFTVKEWNVAGLWVSVGGEQTQHGLVTRWLHVGGEDQCSTSDREELIAALVDAGKLFDSLK